MSITFSSPRPTTSGAAGSAPAPAGGRAGLASANSPSIYLPLRFILTGMLSLVLGVACLAIWPDVLSTYHYNQRVVAVTHLFTLGWICSIVMGAMYQLVPVALECALYSERLGRWQYVFHLVGTAGMVAMFWVWDMKQLGLFGSIFGLGVLLFIYNIVRTLLRIPRWTVVAGAIASALFWLLATMLLGLFVAASKTWPLNYFSAVAQMHAHAHLGVLGLFVMVTVGVSYKLVPMFTLSDLQSPRRAWTSVILLNAGLAGAAPAILLESSWKLVFGLVIVLGLVFYGVELLAIVRHRQRRALDWGVRYFLTAMALLVPAAGCGLVLGWPGLPLTQFTGQLENVYGFLALLGVITFAILGMLYKIVPFLVWYAVYSKQIGRSKVPSLGDLYSTRVQVGGYVLWLAGLAGVSAGALLSHSLIVRFASLLLAVSLGLFLSNLAMILRHMVRPQIQPLVLKRPAPAAAAA